MTKVLYVEHNDDNLYMLKTRLEWVDDFEVIAVEIDYSAPFPASIVNRLATIEIVNEFWGRRNRSPAGEGFVYEGNDCPRIFLGDPTGTGMYSVGSGMVLAIGDLESDVLAGGTYWLRPGSERPRQRRKASLAVIGSV